MNNDLVKSKSTKPKPKPKKAKEVVHEKPIANFDDNIVNIKNIIGITSTKVVVKPTVRSKSQIPWADKYRPRVLKEIIGHDNVKDVLRESIKNGDLPHLLFHGPSGTGKTSTILALVMQLYGPARVNEKVLELNASDENGINVVRDKIISFANIVVGSADPKYPSPQFKIIILDEADAMTSEAQTALKKVMETTCDITRFVFICNYENKIIEAIKSRCASFRFSPIPNEIMIDKLKSIAKSEEMTIDDDVFDVITNICEGDARRSIITLQNLKYISALSDRIGTKITKDDIYNITSFVRKDYFGNLWNRCLTCDVAKITDYALKLTNTGYPIIYILSYFKDRTIESKLPSEMKCDILIYLGKVERMITDGSDNYIQLVGVIGYVNGLYRKLNINSPIIY